MYDFVIMTAFAIIALALVVKTVFYVIEVISQVKVARKSFKICKKILKKYEPLLDNMAEHMDDLL